MLCRFTSSGVCLCGFFGGGRHFKCCCGVWVHHFTWCVSVSLKILDVVQGQRNNSDGDRPKSGECLWCSLLHCWCGSPHLHLFVCLSTSLHFFVHMSISLHLFVCLSTSVHLFVHLSISVYLFVHLSTSFSPSLCTSVHISPSLCTSVHLWQVEGGGGGGGVECWDVGVPLCWCVGVLWCGVLWGCSSVLKYYLYP